jgi:hypothetical protein
MLKQKHREDVYLYEDAHSLATTPDWLLADSPAPRFLLLSHHFASYVMAFSPSKDEYHARADVLFEFIRRSVGGSLPAFLSDTKVSNHE